MAQIIKGIRVALASAGPSWPKFEISARVNEGNDEAVDRFTVRLESNGIHEGETFTEVAATRTDLHLLKETIEKALREI